MNNYSLDPDMCFLQVDTPRVPFYGFIKEFNLWGIVWGARKKDLTKNG